MQVCMPVPKSFKRWNMNHYRVPNDTFLIHIEKKSHRYKISYLCQQIVIFIYLQLSMPF